MSYYPSITNVTQIAAVNAIAASIDATLVDQAALAGSITINMENTIKSARKYIFEKALSLEKQVEGYASDVLFLRNNKVTWSEGIELPATLINEGDIIIPVKVTYEEENGEKFKWWLDDKKRAVRSFFAKPSEVVYRIPSLHGFINNNLLDGNSMLVRLPRILLDPIPPDPSEPLLTWSVGVVHLSLKWTDNKMG